MSNFSGSSGSPSYSGWGSSSSWSNDYSFDDYDGYSNGVPDTGFNGYVGSLEYSSAKSYWDANRNSQDNQARLYADLNESASSTKTLRPEMPTIVYPWFTIMKTLGLSNSGVLSITGLMVIGWLDPRLMWSLYDYDVTEVNMNPNNIWYPPLTLINSATPGSITPGTASTAQVYSSGMVYLYIPVAFDATCSLNLASFPYDSQKCTLLFTSMDSNGTSPGVTFHAPNVSSVPLNYYSSTGEFALSSATLSVNEQFCVSSCFSTFDVTLNYARRSSFYVMTVIIPAFILTFLLALALIVPSDNSIKINISCTLLLSLYFLQQTVSKLLPATEVAPLLSSGVVLSLGLAVFCVVFSIATVITGMAKPSIGKSCGSWLDYFSCLICVPRKMLNKRAKKVPNSVKTELEIDNPFEKIVSREPATGETTVHSITDMRLREQVKILEDIKAKVAAFTRTYNESSKKKQKDGEKARRWRILDTLINIKVFLAYLVVAVVCMLFYDTAVF